MYFWNINELKKDLLKGQLSELETFKYLILDIFITTLGTIPMIGPVSKYEVYNSIIIGIITLFGVYYLFKCNNGLNGKNFVQRYLSLSWVVGVRLMVFTLLPFLLVLIILAVVFSLFYPGKNYLELLGIVLNFSFMIIYFWNISKHIKDLAGKEKINSKVKK